MSVDEKQLVRERVWSTLEQHGAVLPPGARGRIPNFVGAELAADRLAELSAWREARVIKCNPDKAQLPVRLRALAEGKTVYMAVPKLAREKPFYLLDPAELPAPAEQVATGAGAAEFAPMVGVEDMEPVDLVVCGSVAVNDCGTRIGKGAGYSDIEVALLVEAARLSPAATIVSTVHELQVVNGELPEEEHDFRLNFVVTPDRIVNCHSQKAASGLRWEALPPAKIDAIPVLRGMWDAGHSRWHLDRYRHL